jgi:VanZ family protein
VPSAYARALGRWAPPLAWAVLIFGGSSIPGAHLPAPGITHLDKLAHAVEYAVLGGLLLRALAERKRPLLCALLLATLYGVSDELHQRWVPGRDADPADVAADLAGAALGAWLWDATWRRCARR